MLRIILISLVTFATFAVDECKVENSPNPDLESLSLALFNRSGTYSFKDCGEIAIYVSKICSYDQFGYGPAYLSFYANKNKLSQGHQIFFSPEKIALPYVIHSSQKILNFDIDHERYFRLKKRVNLKFKKDIYTDFKVILSEFGVSGFIFKQYTKDLFGKKKYLHKTSCGQTN